MNKVLFVKWLIEVQGLKEMVAKNRASTCGTIEKVYGNLDEYYLLDGCESLRDMIKYTREEEKQGLPPKHLIDIKGNQFTGTATLRQSLNRYIEFMNDKAN